MYSFSTHINKTIAKAKNRLNILKALAGSDWGQDKEVMVMTYKSIIRSILEYGGPIWNPIISDTNWTKLQAVQNQALKIATGCIKMTSSDHVHQEAKVLPLEVHGKMLSKQFLVQCFNPQHPGYKHVTKTLPRRRKQRKTILDYKVEIPPAPADHLPDWRKTTMKRIHTETVRTVRTSYQPNRVLLTHPPRISKSEKELNRKARCKLAQLRSGFSSMLNSYMSRIDPSITNECPKCKQANHDTNHLFNCPSDPPHPFTALDLWTRPKLAARFLQLDEGIT